VYRSAAAVDLRMAGLDAVAPLAVFPPPHDWEALFRLICPA
jgi:hypothetical protein